MEGREDREEAKEIVLLEMKINNIFKLNVLNELNNLKVESQATLIVDTRFSTSSYSYSD